MPVKLTIVRHGESRSNAAGLWQGQHDSPLSSHGREQARRVGDRLGGESFDLVITSDLSRAMETGAAISSEFETDPAWREMSIGRWESKPRSEVEEEDAELLAAVRAGEDVPLGGGERFSEFEARIVEALDRLISRVESTENKQGRDVSVLVVAHGGVISALTRHVLRLPKGPPAFGPLENTSITSFSGRDGTLTLTRFNDASHLGPLNGWASGRHQEGDTLISLFRHGQTVANIESRFASSTDGEMTIDGRRQANSLAEWYPGLDVIYSSPLQRARETAGALAEALGLEVEHRSDLVEMSFGEWENLTIEEIKSGWSGMWREIMERNRDLPRGGDSGETLEALIARMQAAVAELTERHAGARIGVVSHGGSIRSVAMDVLGIDHRAHAGIGFPDNTSVTHLVVGEDGTRLVDYNIAPHLEGTR